MTAQLATGPLGSRALGQAWVIHRGNLRVLREHAGNRERVTLMLGHAERQGAQAPQDQGGAVGRERRAQ